MQTELINLIKIYGISSIVRELAVICEQNAEVAGNIMDYDEMESWLKDSSRLEDVASDLIHR